MRPVIAVRRGPIVKHRNGTTVHEWVTIVMECGHEIVRQDLKNPKKDAPRRARCPKCCAAVQ